MLGGKRHNKSTIFSGCIFHLTGKEVFVPESKVIAGPCNPACTSIIKFMTDQKLLPGEGINVGLYKSVDGYRHINIFVQFTQAAADEPPVDLGVMFAFDANGKMGARRYVNLEQNLSGPQSTNFIEVSGQGSWHGSQWNISSYMARFPVMGPFIEVFVYNRAAKIQQTVNVWGYLVS